jgi:hypothetical protein
MLGQGVYVTLLLIFFGRKSAFWIPQTALEAIVLGAGLIVALGLLWHAVSIRTSRRRLRAVLNEIDGLHRSGQ